MEPDELVRVVALNKGKVKAAEFKLRSRESGLSLFANDTVVGYAEIIEAVREMGKRGELAAAVIPAQELRRLGLVLVKTPGNTMSPVVNRHHYEARLPWLRRLLLALRGLQFQDYFNQHLSPKIAATVRLMGREEVS